MWSRRKPGEHSRSGFIMIEVLVTAAVAAVLLAALMRAFSTVWGNIGGVREETEAMLVARAVIEASTPRLNLAPVTQQGTSGRYSWTISVASTGIQMADAPREGQTQGAAPVAPGLTNQTTTPTRPAPGDQESGRNPNNPNESGDEQANQEPPWTLFRIAVAVLAPSGRRTTLETFRLSRPAPR